MKKNKKPGFTLAEVLITLTIIGVVAAMTIPTLMSKYQEKALESQFKKSYTVLSQAIALQQNHGYECYLDDKTSSSSYSDCIDFWTALLEQLKYTKESDDTDDIQYKTAEEIASEDGLSRPGACLGIWEYPDSKKYYMADGSTLFLYMSLYEMRPNFIQIDVNGDKGPNKWGYDVFNLIPFKRTNGLILLSDAIGTIVEKGGKRIKNILLSVDEVDESLWKW